MSETEILQTRSDLLNQTECDIGDLDDQTLFQPLHFLILATVRQMLSKSLARYPKIVATYCIYISAILIS